MSDYIPDWLRSDLEALDGDTSRIEAWLQQQGEYVIGARRVLREIQLLMREAQAGNKRQRNQAIQQAHDIITASYPDFDEISVPDEAEIKSGLEENVERGLMERVGDGYRLTAMGRAYVEHKKRTDPEMREFLRRLRDGYE